MRLQKVICCFLFSLLFHYANANSLSPNDTIRLKPYVKKKAPYPNQPTIIKTNPSSMLWGPIFFSAEYRLMIEMSTTKKQSMQFGISYLGKSPIWSIIEKSSKTGWRPNFVISGLRVQIANKFYFVRKNYASPYGFYIAPSASYANAHIALSKARAYRHTYIDATQLSADILAGVQRGRGKRFTTDIYAGIGYKKNIWLYHATTYRTGPFNTSDFPKIFNSPVKLTFGINIGWTIN